MTTRKHARLSSHRISDIGPEPYLFGTHSLRWTKATLIHRPTRNLQAVQRLLGYTKIGSTVRHLGIEVDDALANCVYLSSSSGDRPSRWAVKSLKADEEQAEHDGHNNAGTEYDEKRGLPVGHAAFLQPDGN